MREIRRYEAFDGTMFDSEKDMENKTTYCIAYGDDGDFGFGTIFGIGTTPEEAIEDSKKYGYDVEADEPHLFFAECDNALYDALQDNNIRCPWCYHWNGFSKEPGTEEIHYEKRDGKDFFSLA